jgi:hypothetical protein
MAIEEMRVRWAVVREQHRGAGASRQWGPCSSK